MTDRSGKEVVRVWHCYDIIMDQSQPGGSTTLSQATLAHSFSHCFTWNISSPLCL